VAEFSAAQAPVIRVTGVSVAHPGRADPAPDNVTLTIRPGRLTVISGPSGCGKTTLLNCLLGLSRPTAGTITPLPGSLAQPTAERRTSSRNGRPVPFPRPASALEPPGLAVGWLPQEPVLFAGTVADNIRLGWPQAPGHLVAAAARDAAVDEVDLDRIVGERGTGLSAGQRRRVALARALLPGAPLLLLDEPTAGLDADREARVVATLIRYAAAGHTVVAVSHRQALLDAADEIASCTAGQAAAAIAGTRAEVPA
jgi:ATP-binding cassette subfamily C protein CydCD